MRRPILLRCLLYLEVLLLYGEVGKGSPEQQFQLQYKIPKVHVYSWS